MLYSHHDQVKYSWPTPTRWTSWEKLRMAWRSRRVVGLVWCKASWTSATTSTWVTRRFGSLFSLFYFFFCEKKYWYENNHLSSFDAVSPVVKHIVWAFFPLVMIRKMGYGWIRCMHLGLPHYDCWINWVLHNWTVSKPIFNLLKEKLSQTMMMMMMMMTMTMMMMMMMMLMMLIVDQLGSAWIQSFYNLHIYIYTHLFFPAKPH